ncbi:uncharacterized protein LOC127277588 [Leptopilina boulardi]|uniref:uncharacterized protein LOC127277588 n=1 Tax=Leptopilina boulardi TaxID=63433 RepID=UPI0021F58A82|nr:uncharacterized protein LOC127277588 [Leptopilina boulardi]
MPRRAYCKFLEFKSTAFREKICSLLSIEEKEELLQKTVKIFEHNFRKCEACGEGKFLRNYPIEYSNSFFREVKKNSIEPEPQEGFLQIKKFSHIDYRNCQCNIIINSLFWNFPIHFNQGENNIFLIRFLIQIGAALVENAEFGYGIKILTLALEKNKMKVSN